MPEKYLCTSPAPEKYLYTTEKYLYSPPEKYLYTSPASEKSENPEKYLYTIEHDATKRACINNRPTKGVHEGQTSSIRRKRLFQGLFCLIRPKWMASWGQ